MDLPRRPKIPLSRAAQLVPFLEFLDRIGAPTEGGLERHKLPSGLREHRGMFASTYRMFAFVADMARREGIESFGWRVASPRLTQLSPRLVGEFYGSPTLYRGLETVCAQAHRESSNATVWLEEHGSDLFVCHRGSLRRGASGAGEANIMRTAFLTYVIRIFTGARWVPDEVGIATTGAIGERVREELQNVRPLPTAEVSWLRLPRSILGRAPRPVPADRAAAPGWGGDEPALDLVGSLAQVLRPYVAQGPPSVKDAADVSGLSVRTLQRALARVGSSYRDVLQRIKLDVARELLEQRDVRIVDVAHATGFQNPPHFTRFFRRHAGMTPREYRRSVPDA